MPKMLDSGLTTVQQRRFLLKLRRAIKNALIEEIAVADTLNQDEWTYSSWSALNAAYNAAKKLNNDSSATVEELMDAHADLKMLWIISFLPQWIHPNWKN